MRLKESYLEIDLTVRKEVNADVKKAKADGEIGIEEFYYNVYEQNLEGDLRGLTPWDLHKHKKTVKGQNVV